MNRGACALAAVPLLLSACGGSSDGSRSTGSGTTTGAPGAQTATIDMNDELQFVPSTLNGKVGTVTLDVRNIGLVPHNLHFDEGDLGKTGTIDGKKSEQLKVSFDKAGTYTFQCTFHSGMTGKVVVS